MNITARGLLFKAEMIRVLLNSKPDVWPAEPIDPSKPFKWQTRRIIKDTTQPEPDKAVLFTGRKWSWATNSGKIGVFMWNEFTCPFVCGDIFYAKETYAYTGEALNIKPGFVYRATDPDWSTMEGFKWKPSIFMPKTAARLWCKVKNIRVERVNAITGSDARAEGVYGHDNQVDFNAIGRYRNLWDSINGEGDFEKGRFVFAYDIARISRP